MSNVFDKRYGRRKKAAMNKLGFLTPDHPDAFVDFPPVQPPKPGYGLSDTVCPRCHGHGGWNLRLNCYPLHGKPDTPENRHQFVHFRQLCPSCNGWGYFREGQTCAHSWSGGVTVGKCLTEYTCVKCGAVSVVDSSD